MAAMATDDQNALSTAASQETLQAAIHTPLPVESDLPQPKPPFLSAGSLSPRNSSLRDSYVPATSDDAELLAAKESDGGDTAETPVASKPQQQQRRRLRLLLFIILAVIAVLVVAIVVPVYFKVIQPKINSATSGSTSTTASASQPTSSSGPKSPDDTAVWGGDGSTVRATNGSTFTYNNKFGGIWYYDQNDPHNNNAYPNSWTPPLNQSWDFAKNRIYGVNLGGWFVLEPFITPTLYQKYPGAIDEWTLSTLMAADTASGGLNQLEDHYKTFITEDDIAEIAGAGLNWVRIPIPFWAIDAWDGEPFLGRTCWKYILQALQWCRKYGLRVKIDLHTIPGSQNGYNHSGKGGGNINFLRGTMGMANAQRALNYIRIFTEFFSQPEWKDLVVIFGVVNEPIPGAVGEEQLRSFNYEAYRMVRDITGIGAGNGPYVSYHDGFLTVTMWAGFLSGADRIIIDGHPYFAFDGTTTTDPIDSGTGAGAGGTWPSRACTRWASSFNTSRSAFGVTIAGEWSVALNGCGLFVLGTATPGNTGTCAEWSDSSGWSDGTKAGLMRLAMASMDSFRDWFFWTWKVGPSQRGVVEAPFWSYQLGLRGGWLPTDPRTAIGACGATGPAWDGTFASWMTGGTGAGQLSSTYSWPPASFANAPAPPTALPQYTATGSISTLPVPTYTDTAGKAIVSGSGWFNANDNRPAPAPIAGCAYPNAWDAADVAVPAGCGVPAAAGPLPATSVTGILPTTTAITTTSTSTTAAAAPTI